jgi:predicted RNA-binding protein with EMAP domain
MGRIVRLTERDLTRLVKRIIKETKSIDDYDLLSLSELKKEFKDIITRAKDIDEFEDDSYDFINAFEEDMENLSHEDYIELNDYMGRLEKKYDFEPDFEPRKKK